MLFFARHILLVLLKQEKIQVTSVDTRTSETRNYGKEQLFERRVFLVFDGIHYDGGEHGSYDILYCTGISITFLPVLSRVEERTAQYGHKGRRRFDPPCLTVTGEPSSRFWCGPTDVFRCTLLSVLRLTQLMHKSHHVLCHISKKLWGCIASREQELPGCERSHLPKMRAYFSNPLSTLSAWNSDGTLCGRKTRKTLSLRGRPAVRAMFCALLPSPLNFIVFSSLSSPLRCQPLPGQPV